MLGGGFGRRSETDFVRDAARVAARLGGCVQVVWTREDDIRGGAYRPMAFSRLRGAVDADGWPVAWSHDLQAPPFSEHPRRARGEGGGSELRRGASELPYDIPHQKVRYADVAGSGHHVVVALGGELHERVLRGALSRRARATWRATPTSFVACWKGQPRHLAVLDAAASAASWGSPLPEGRARGIAVHESYGSFVAQVAEVSVQRNGTPRVHALTCAVDCGRQIHPDAIRAQMEGSVAYGLSAALYGKIELAQGRAVQSNFHDYPILRMDEMPKGEGRDRGERCGAWWGRRTRGPAGGTRDLQRAARPDRVASPSSSAAVIAAMPRGAHAAGVSCHGRVVPRAGAPDEGWRQPLFVRWRARWPPRPADLHRPRGR